MFSIFILGFNFAFSFEFCSTTFSSWRSHASVAPTNADEERGTRRSVCASHEQSAGPQISRAGLSVKELIGWELWDNEITVLDAIYTYGGNPTERAAPIRFGSSHHTSTHDFLCIIHKEGDY